MLMFLALTVGIIFVDQGQRRIPIQFSKRIRGRRMLGGQSTYIPLKVNTAGVIPVIFASSVLYFPALVASSIPPVGFWGAIRRFIDNNLVSGSRGGTWSCSACSSCSSPTSTPPSSSTRLASPT
jgi:preprotein translocase subunit SecY